MTAAAFVVAVTLLLPPAIGPRAVGGTPTGSVPGRTGPDILGSDEPEQAGVPSAELEQLADPYDVETRLTLADGLLAAGLADQAAVHYRQAVSARPDDPMIRVTLSAALLQLGDADGAQRHAARVLQDRPDHPEALLLAGMARVADGDPQGQTNLRRFLQVAPAEHPGRRMAHAVLDRDPPQP